MTPALSVSTVYKGAMCIAGFSQCILPGLR